MPIFQAFLDESGKFRDKRVVSFCGFCAPVSKLAAFQDEWHSLLRLHGMPELSMKRALRRKVKLGTNTDAHSIEERIDALRPFAECARNHFELGVAIVVDVDAYKDWPIPAKQRFAAGSPNPHYFAFLNAMMCCTKFAGGEERVSLVCDDDKETAMNCYALYRRSREVDPHLRGTLIAITFANDREFLPLQAADLLASICRLEAGRRMHREYYEYMPLFQALTSPIPTVGMKWCQRFFDKEELEKLASKPVRRDLEK